ncbi:MAG: hypothetical protein EXS16_15720 [Gemmataceae bacterium]|nr:hypothetical protein [Gemmataceae bacterium]
MFHRMHFSLAMFIALTAMIGLLGCKDTHSHAKKTDDPAKTKTTAAHDHPEAGPHGGKLIEWGGDVFHVEFTIDTVAKTVTLYILDDKANPSPKIDAAKISKVKVHILSTKPSVTVDMKHDSKKSGDKDGVAFVGTHDLFGTTGEILLTVDGVVEGHPAFSGDHKHQPTKKK